MKHAVSIGGNQRAFRKWLVARVEGTRFATMRLTDDDVDKYAAQLGVVPEVLLQARVNMKLALANASVPPMGTHKYAHRCRVLLCFAREPWEAWQQHVSDWGIDGPAILRSLIHLYLRGAYEPSEVQRTWIWEGRRVNVVRDGTCREKSLISRGARSALNMRAAMRGCSPMALMRALVMENMAGKFGRRGMLRIVDTRSMYEDQERYFLA